MSGKKANDADRQKNMKKKQKYKRDYQYKQKIVLRKNWKNEKGKHLARQINKNRLEIKYAK